MSTGIFYSLGLDPTKLVEGLTRAGKAVKLFSGLAMKIGAIGIGAGLAGAGVAALGMKKAISEAANMEGLETSFEVLLGSVDKAKKRMQELAKFAAETPFELPGVARASRVLQTLTDGALATGDGLRLVGDVASMSQQPFDEIAVAVGRLYSGMQSGREVGEAMARLQELGAIAPDVRSKLEQLQATGKKGEGVWQVAAASLGRFSGMMDKQSRTWNGLMSNLQDSIDAVFREFGAPLIDALKPMLQETIAMTDKLAPIARKFGEDVAMGLRTVRELFASGKLWEVPGMILQLGFQTAAQKLGEALHAVFAVVRDESGRIFDGLKVAFLGMGAILTATFREAITSVMKDVKILGVGVMKPEAVEANMEMAGVERFAGGFALQSGLQKMLGAAMPGIDLTRDIDATRAALQALMEEARDAAIEREDLEFLQGLQGLEDAAGPKIRQAGEEISSASLKMSVPSDRLSRIGGFIGFAGGPQGQRAAEDTARNTGKMVTLNEKILTQVSRPPKPATF